MRKFLWPSEKSWTLMKYFFFLMPLKLEWKKQLLKKFTKFYQLLKKIQCNSIKVSIPFGCIWSLCNSKIGLDRRIDQYLIKRQEKQDLFKTLMKTWQHYLLINLWCLDKSSLWTHIPTQNYGKNRIVPNQNFISGRPFEVDWSKINFLDSNLTSFIIFSLGQIKYLYSYHNEKLEITPFSSSLFCLPWK